MGHQMQRLSAATALSLAVAFGGTTALAQDETLEQGTTITADNAELVAWYGAVRPLSYISSPEDQCAPMHMVTDAESPYQREKALRLQEVMGQTDLTAASLDGFAANGGGICFVDFSEYGNGGMKLNFAVHFPHYNIVLINDMPDIDEGCQVAAAIHETHHGAQKYAGVEAPVRDLTIDDQENLIVTIEADAHTMQIVGGEILAQAGYAGAQECNRNYFASSLPHFQNAVDALDAVVAEDEEALENGAAATAVYNSFATDWELVRRYSGGFRFMYDCDSYPDQCFRQRYTLDDLGIDLGNLSTIVYEEGYEVTPYAVFKPEVMANRP